MLRHPLVAGLPALPGARRHGRARLPSSLAGTTRPACKLTAIRRLRADFVANASHELRTPLASLLGFIETLNGPARGDREARTSF